MELVSMYLLQKLWEPAIVNTFAWNKLNYQQPGLEKIIFSSAQVLYNVKVEKMLLGFLLDWMNLQDFRNLSKFHELWFEEQLSV